ncbi:MAG: nucleotidyltransferase family protein [Gammaproteobacteria bacterium]|nr:nucleotidyltransferase family protein [Gammaproteobacteria bacterium]
MSQGAKPVKAMILAAGRGERMRPLTDQIPKPLLEVGGKPLIQFHIEALVDAGIRDLVINVSYLGELIVERLGDGSQFGASIVYSEEPPGALETGGGIYHALPLLGDTPFLVVNGDVWTDFKFSNLSLAENRLAHLVLVRNPDHHPEGDFILEEHLVQDRSGERFTYSGIGMYDPRLFSSCQAGAFPLAPLLRREMRSGLVSGQYYAGGWHDVGTPARLKQLNDELELLLSPLPNRRV